MCHHAFMAGGKETGETDFIHRTVERFMPPPPLVTAAGIGAPDRRFDALAQNQTELDPV